MKLLIITQKVDSEDDILGFFHEWIKRMAAKVEHIDVICLRSGEIALPDNVRVFTLGRFRKVSMSWRIFLLSRKCDTIFCHMSPIFTILAAPSAKLFRKQLVMWHTHGAVTFKLKLAVRLADKVLTASEESMKVKTQKKIVMGHGIDLNKFRPAWT